MKAEEILIKLKGFNHTGILISGFYVPRHKFLGVVKYRVIAIEFKCIFSLGSGLFATAVKLQGIED